MSRVLASGVLPVTLEFLDQVCIGAVEDYAHIGLNTSAGALLIFGQDGNPTVIEHDLERMAQACAAEGATSVRIAESPEAAAEVLEARRAALPSLSRLEPLTLLEDATVPRSRIAEMVEYVQDVARRERLREARCGSVVGGRDPQAERVGAGVHAMNAVASSHQCSFAVVDLDHDVVAGHTREGHAVAVQDHLDERR